MAEKSAETTTSTAPAAMPTAGQAGVADVRAILIVADEGVFMFDLATEGRE